MINIVFPISILTFFFAIFFKYKRTHLISLIKDLRYLRVGHYLLFGLLGASLRPDNVLFPEMDLQLIFNIIFSILSIIFGIVFSIITNNIVDAEIDKVSNPNRPLVRGVFEKKEYLNYAYIFLFLSLTLALFVNLSIFLSVAIFIGAYFIYSVPPLRIKRIPIISKWVIGLNSLVLINMGRILFYPDNPLPLLPSIILVLGIGLVSNFIDLKDIEGDRVGKIRTLPTILGEKKSKRLIGLFFIMVYPSSLILLRPFFSTSFLLSVLLPFILLLSLLQYWVINRKNYSEVPVFLLNNFATFFIAVCLIW